MSETVVLHIIDRKGEKHTIDADVGKTLKDVIVRDIPMDHFGDCGGCCACATCHLYIESSMSWALNGHEKLSEDESDMLEMSEGVTSESRLGCQVEVNPQMDGMTITVAQDL
jgi:2Fe-2S ferredoxin